MSTGTTHLDILLPNKLVIASHYSRKHTHSTSKKDRERLEHISLPALDFESHCQIFESNQCMYVNVLKHKQI